MLILDCDDTERPTCAKRSRERLNTLKVFALAALSWAVSSLWSASHVCGQFVGGAVANNKDFLVGTPGAAGTVAGSYFTYLQFDKAYRASDEYKIQTAVQDFLKPYPKRKEEQVVRRDIMNTIKKLITEWSLQTEKATILSGRYMSGKTVAVNEALRRYAEFAVSSSLMSNRQIGRRRCIRNCVTRACSRKSCAECEESLQSSRTIRPSSPYFCWRFTAKS